VNPERIGGYEIIGELGRGAMGVVYHARDAAIGRSVAIKVIRIDAGTSREESAQLRQRLIREASVAGNIYHPGIVTVHQLGEEGENVFIVMEFVEGSSLEHLLTNNPSLDRAWALDILAQVAVALDYAHKGGVVHRDVKPANLLVRSDGRVKIADFGIAKLTAGATRGMTAAGVSVGSPAYMSPEQIHAHDVDGRSDQFALGTIAFQMLAGRMPFRGITAHTLMFQIVTADPFEPQPGDIPLPAGVTAVLGRALAKNPADRFPDCASFIQQLTVAANGGTAASLESTAKIEVATPKKAKESKSWILAPIVGALLTLGLAGSGIYWWVHRTCCAPDPVPVAIATPRPEPTPTPAPAPIETPAPAPIETPAPSPVAEASPVTKPAPAKKSASSEASPTITLHAAVTYGKADVVKALLAKGANINETDSSGSTPLMIAAGGTPYLANNLPMIGILIDARASLEARDSQGRRALHRAASEGQTAAAALLLNSGALINPKATDGATPLFYAVQFGKKPVMDLLVARHAQVDLADATGATPLMIASEGTSYITKSAPLVEALLNAGAHVDTVDTLGRSALYRASAAGKPDVVHVLLGHHAKPNLRANDGSTALIEAVTFSRPLIAQNLLSHGADVNLADSKSNTPLMIAAEKTPTIKDSARFIKMLLEHGAKRDLKDAQGRTALQRAKESKNASAVELLK